MNTSPHIDFSPIFFQLYLPIFCFGFFILILKLFLKTISAKLKGKLGELKVNRIHRALLDKRIYHPLNNILLHTKDRGSTQIDHVIISVYGIFVIETKNMKGWIFGSEKQDMWTQTFRKSKYSFQNPLRQNYKHVKALSEILNLPEDKFIPIITFTGNCEFKTKMPDNVLNENHIPYILSKNEMLLNYEEVTNIIEKLEAYNIPLNIKNKRKHIDYVNTIKEKKKYKGYHTESQTQQSHTKKDKYYTTKNPVTNPQGFNGINIGHYPLPNFETVQNIDSNLCCICGTSLSKHILDYCLDNKQKFKGNVYCHKHLKE
ncbi:MAG: nuclease-related domain-containing protein [Candidatus Brocadiaceae bacterium]